jgi:hypothetical protein
MGAKRRTEMIKQTLLAAGQCYVDIGSNPWRNDRHLTVLKLVDRPGDRDQIDVTYGFNGAIVTVPANQLETNITAGVLAPVVAEGRVATC